MPAKNKSKKSKPKSKKVSKLKSVKKTKKPACSKKCSAAKKKVTKKTKAPKKDKNVAGVVTHYFPHVNAAVVKVKQPISVGDKIEINGHTTHIEETVDSMQIDHVAIKVAKRGDEIGLHVSDRVREGDVVKKI